METLETRRATLEHFDAWAPKYDKSVLHAWFRFLHQSVAARVRLPPVGGVLLDVGCGTGGALVAARQVQPGAATLGVDLSPGMLREARRKGLPRLVAGDAGHLPLDAGSVDAILCTASFHHYPDPEGAAREFVRVLKPGGELHLVDVSAPRVLIQALEYVMHRIPFTGRRVHSVWRARRILRDAGFRTMRTHWLGPVARHTIAVKPRAASRHEAQVAAHEAKRAAPGAAGFERPLRDSGTAGNGPPVGAN